MGVKIDGAGLRREMALRGVDQNELATEAGISESTLVHALARGTMQSTTFFKVTRALYRHKRTPLLEAEAFLVRD